MPPLGPMALCGEGSGVAWLLQSGPGEVEATHVDTAADQTDQRKHSRRDERQPVVVGMNMLGELPPLQRLLLAHAPAGQRDWQQLVWTLDQRLAAIVRGVSEPMIALIRMAWWEEALVSDDRAKGNGEPLVEAWRAIAPDEDVRAHAARLIEGWRVLIEGGSDGIAIDLQRYADERGSGLFGLIGGTEAGASPAGALWALWDLAGHVSDRTLAERAIAMAHARASASPTRAAGLPRALRLAMKVALPDVQARRISGPFAPRHYLRLLRGLLFA